MPYNESDAQDFVNRVAEGWQGNVAVFAIDTLADVRDLRPLLRRG